MSDMIVQVHNLKKRYEKDGVLAVNGISFGIGTGELFSLLGPNGAGKSTTISMLSGLLPPTDGDALIDGISIKDDILSVKEKIGVVPQEIALYPTISASENLKFWGRMYGLRGTRLEKRIAEVLDIAGLTDRAGDKVESYSGGMKRRLNIAVGLLHEPKILYMDEPTVGIDPQSRRRILDTIKELNAEGMTILYTTHYMEEAQELSDRIGIIDRGELVAVGTMDELTRKVGRHDTIRLKIDGQSASTDLTDRMRALPGVHSVAAESGSILMQVTDGDQLLPDLISVLQAAGASLRGIDIKEPNLEAVFLHLTGRALRD